MAKAKRKGAARIVEGILIGIVIVCLVGIGAIALQYYLQAQRYSDLSGKVYTGEEAALGGDLARMTVDWDALREEAPDAIGWIVVPDTVINYPIVQGPDNEYYLHRSYDGETSWLSTGGTIFLDAGNKGDFSDMNNVLYGHHMNDGSMFAFLAQLTNQGEFESNRTIYVLTPTMNYRLETFSVVLTVGSDEIVKTSFGTAEEFAEYIQDKVDRNVVEVNDFVADASSISKIFMLVTCEYSNNDGRACVFAYVTEQAAPLSE